MAKLPSFQFYPGDWLKDAALRSCSLAAQGAWMNLICIAFDMSDRGIFRQRGAPWTRARLARIGAESRPRYVDELVENGVLKLSARTKTYYCKRVLLDELQRARGARRKRKHDEIRRLGNGKVTAKSRPSSSSSSSSSSTSVTKKKDAQPFTLTMFPPELDTPEFKACWKVWAAHRDEIGAPITLTSTSLLLKELVAMGHDRAVAAIEHTVAKGWKGIQEPDKRDAPDEEDDGANWQAGWTEEDHRRGCRLT